MNLGHGLRKCPGQSVLLHSVISCANMDPKHTQKKALCRALRGFLHGTQANIFPKITTEKLAKIVS